MFFIERRDAEIQRITPYTLSAQRVAEATCKGRKDERSLSANSANVLAFLSKLTITLILCASAFNSYTCES